MVSSPLASVTHCIFLGVEKFFLKPQKDIVYYSKNIPMKYNEALREI